MPKKTRVFRPRREEAVEVKQSTTEHWKHSFVERVPYATWLPRQVADQTLLDLCDLLKQCRTQSSAGPT